MSQVTPIQGGGVAGFATIIISESVAEPFIAWCVGMVVFVGVAAAWARSGLPNGNGIL